ncbi:MAG: DNA primase [Clostridiales bacterium]|nr:DNA primase [Clostridiales bacterium]
MAKIPESTIEEVLSRADIESVVGQYVTFTKRTGQNLFGLCPFHSENTPSFSVSIPKQIYKCFGCQKYGNSIGFIMEMEKLSFPEAVKYLGDRYGVDVQWGDDDSENTKNLKERKKRVMNILTDAAGYYYKALNSDAGKAARDYAAKRQLSNETLTKFGIGYAPDGFDNLYSFLKSKGYNDEDLNDSGLFTRSKKGNLIDLFRGRFIVPIFDAFGKIIAFGGRNLGPELPKYVNSPDSLVYKKQNHLYALNFVPRNTKQLIIVEGYMDAIAMHQAGINNAVAALGTSFTDSQLRLASKYAEEVVFFFDSDKAGKAAAIRATNMMLAYLKRMTGIKIRIRIASVPEGKDPDEYIKTYGADSFKSVVKSAKDVNDYLFDRAYDDNYDKDSGLDLTKYQEDIITYGSWIYDPIKREKMAVLAAQYLGARAETILFAMEHAEKAAMEASRGNEQRESERKEKTEVEQRRTSAPVKVPNADRVTRDEIELFVRAVRLGGVLADETKIERNDVIRKNDFSGSNMKEIVGFFLEHFNEKTGVSDALLITKMSDLLLNGLKAETFYIKASEQISRESNINAEVDMYKRTLYNVRLKKSQDELKLVDSLIQTTEDKDKREEYIELNNKIELYRQKLIEKRNKL